MDHRSACAAPLPIGILIGLFGIVLGVASLGAEAEQPAAVIARVYNAARLPAAVLAGLRASAGKALAPAQIAVRWLSCSGAVPQGECLAAPEHDVIVRVVDWHGTLGANHCGFAVTEGRAAGFISLSRECAARVVTELRKGRAPGQPEPATEAEVLGYTLAHEIAHVLLPGVPHSGDGIFAAHLGHKQWQRLRNGGLSFLRHDIERLHAAVLQRQASSEADASQRVASLSRAPNRNGGPR